MKNILKSSYKLVAGTILLSVTISCNNEVLDLLPANVIAYEDAFSTPKMCELSMVGCYDAAQSGYYPGNLQRRGYPFGAASIEQGDMRGEDMMNIQAFFAVTYGATYSTSSPNGQAMWECTYQMMNKVNICIEGFQMAGTKGVLTEQQAKEYEAEARFLRALGYHELLIHFSYPYSHSADASHHGVPLSLKAINSADKIEEAKSAGRATVKQVYQQIIDDLDYAESNLPETRSSSALKISRACKGAAIGLKTRIYQHMGMWDKVNAEASKIVDANFKSPIGGYALTASPAGPFLANSNNSESMFSIENSDLDNATVNGSLSQFYTKVRSLIGISPIMFNADFWLKEDLRRSLLVAKDISYKNVFPYWIDKYKTYEKMSDWAPILRYSEIILNYAEAEARLNGVTTKAVDLLNQVRNRALTDPFKHYSTSDFADVQSLMKAILQERRIEFLGEGRRWADIHRLANDPEYFVPALEGKKGVPAKVNGGSVVVTSWDEASGNVTPSIISIKAFSYDDRRFLFPIPDSETSTNEVLKSQQNPGW